MTPADGQAFAGEMLRLYAALGRPAAVPGLSADQDADLRAEAYFDALEGFTIAEVRGAMRHAAATADYFPRPAELARTIRTERRRAAAEMRALPVPREPTDAERREVRGLLEGLYAKLAAVGRWASGHPAPMAVGDRTPEDVARLERRRAEELERFREGM